MKKKYLKTLIAVLILGALWGSFTYYDKYQKAHGAEEIKAKAKTEKLLALKKDSIRSFTIQPRDGEPFTCAREGLKWSITQPHPLPANSEQISTFLDVLTTIDVKEVVDPHPSNLKDFGLDPPATTIELTTDANPSRVALKLGDQTPTSAGLYAQVEGNPRVVTVPGYQRTALEKTVFDLRDKRAFTLDPDQIQSIEVSSKGSKWTLTKNPEGVWDLNLPPAVRADHFTVDGMVNSLRTLSMESILAEDKKSLGAYGFGSPALTVRLTSPGGTQTITLGKKDGDNYDAMNSALDPVFTLGSYFLTQFQKTVADLRDKDLFSFSTFEAKAVDVTTPKGHRAFSMQHNAQKKTDVWKQTAPAAKDETKDKMDALLDDLTELRATSFPSGTSTDLAPYGLVDPAYVFKVVYGDNNQTQTVQVGVVGNHYYARRSTDPLPGEISKSSVDAIDKALGDL